MNFGCNVLFLLRGGLLTNMAEIDLVSYMNLNTARATTHKTGQGTHRGRSVKALDSITP